MSGSKSAHELADLIVERELKHKQRSADKLRSKCRDAINQMMIDMEYSTEIEFEDSELAGLIEVTEELRSLDYKFRFIEVQDSNGNTKKHKLFISIEHAK